MEEIWKDVPNYEGLYKVSNLGRIKSKTKILKPYLCKKTGYVNAHLSKNGISKVMRLHRIVAMAFIKNFENKPYINHIDGNKSNNCIENLEWCTQKENVIHAIKVLNINYANGIEKMHLKNQKKVIRSDGKVYNSIKEAKKDIKNRNAHIVEVCQGKLKSACGYGWKYLEKGD